MSTLPEQYAGSSAALTRPLLNFNDVSALAGARGRTTLWRLIHAGLFPPPLDCSHLGTRRLWAGEAVRRWVADQLEGVVGRDWRTDWPNFQGSVDAAYDYSRRELPKSANSGSGREDMLARLSRSPSDA